MNRESASPLESDFIDWVTRAMADGASDLHLVVGHPPMLRVHGRLRACAREPLEASRVESLLASLCSPANRERFLAERNLDFALPLELAGRTRRLRANYFLSGRQWGACFRIIPAEIPSFEWSGFPLELAGRLTGFRDGLVVICGVTGAGKTTTLAMLVNLLNERGDTRIVTVEEPIEYLFPRHELSVVTQREVGVDVASFADGLKYCLRQDPDVILVGEVRDRETAQMALSAAETGHLVFATLHTRDAKGAISRLTDFFPQDVQFEIRSQLSLGLRAVVSQHLLPSTRPDGKRELALEILFNNAPIASAIRVGKIETIDNNVTTGRADGMVSLNESIKRLWQSGRVTADVAERYVTDRAFLHR